MKFGYLRTDESGHEYIIPEELVKQFDSICRQIDVAQEDSDDWYDLCDQLDNEFGQYRDNAYDKKILIEE